jgi:hypothetical protein
MVAIPALFMNLSEVTDLSVIGTLFAFTIVCAGVLVKDKEFAGQKRFVPYINSRYIAPVLFIVTVGLIIYLNGEAASIFLTDLTPTADEVKEEITTAGSVFLHRMPYFVFALFSLVMLILCIVKRLSLIPVLGVMCCTYLMTELGWTNWFRFGIWLLAGLVLYFAYGFWKSKLRNRAETSAEPA